MANQYSKLTRLERFVEKIQFTETCWLWTGAKKGKGYGGFSVKGYAEYAHIVSYKGFVGKIPRGYEVHHLCEVKRCVNPDHLVAVRPLIHKWLTWGWRMRKGQWFCSNGHKINLASHEVGRGCKRCDNIAGLTRYHEKRNA